MYKPVYQITDEILARISEIEELRSLARTYRILPEREAFIHQRATVEATHSSTSIEGNPLNIRQVEKVLSSRDKIAKKHYAAIEVRNYKDSLDWISKRARERRSLEEEDLLTLHKIITKSLLDNTRSGKIRKNPVYIVDQNGDTVYKAPPAANVQKELKNFFTWLNSPKNATHSVIVAGILHYVIASIHPFADGNGRTARAAVSLYLSLNGYDFRDSLVLDSYYAVDRKAYYDALKSAQQGEYDKAKTADLASWLDYFTEGFLSSVEILMLELQALSAVRAGISPKRLKKDESDILSYVTNFGSISLSEASDILPDVSRRTLQRTMQRLVKGKYLKPKGSGPSTKYVLAR